MTCCSEVRWKSFEIKAEAAEPTDDDLAVINREYALTPLSKDEVYVRRIKLANDLYDRTDERFPRTYLQRFAETLPGKSLLGNHDHTSFPLGRFHAASVKAAPSGPTWLETRFYMVRTPGNEEMRKQIDGGVYSHTSIGYRYDDLDCDLCGKSYYSYDCPHYSGNVYDGKRCRLTYSGDVARAEALEGSLVYLGAQYGAQAAKLADPISEKRKRLEDDKAAHPFRRLPLAPRAREWDASAAEAGVRAWAEAEGSPNARYARAFLWSGGDETKFDSYKLPYAAVIDGQLHAVPKGLFAAAERLDQTDIPESDRETVRTVLTRWYARMADEFDDSEIRPPWAGEGEDAAPPVSAKFSAELDAVLATAESAIARGEEVRALRAADGRSPFGAERAAQLTQVRQKLGFLCERADALLAAPACGEREAQRALLARELLIIEADLAMAGYAGAAG